MLDGITLQGSGDLRKLQIGDGVQVLLKTYMDSLYDNVKPMLPVVEAVALTPGMSESDKKLTPFHLVVLRATRPTGNDFFRYGIFLQVPVEPPDVPMIDRMEEEVPPPALDLEFVAWDLVRRKLFWLDPVMDIWAKVKGKILHGQGVTELEADADKENNRKCDEAGEKALFDAGAPGAALGGLPYAVKKKIWAQERWEPPSIQSVVYAADVCNEGQMHYWGLSVSDHLDSICQACRNCNPACKIAFDGLVKNGVIEMVDPKVGRDDFVNLDPFGEDFVPRILLDKSGKIDELKRASSSLMAFMEDNE